jgi:hypothetical protein
VLAAVRAPGGLRHLLRDRQSGAGHRGGDGAETEQGRGILGIIDGFHTQGAETEEDIATRPALLRRFGYKAG